jgi:hypothetical protein
MALHPVKLPKSARELCRIVAMQRLLLKALCAEPMGEALIDEAWLRSIWKTQGAAWIKKFCRKRKYSVLDPIKVIAGASLEARQAVYNEFCRQNRVKKLFEAGGQFTKLTDLAPITGPLAKEVHRLFVRFYMFLSHDAGAKWNGYEFVRGRSIKNESYKADLETCNRPSMNVCPYCDGTNDAPELDHYYAKESFPLLSCSPWNLVPVCHQCNKLNAKAGSIALTPGAPNPTADWLHPFFRPASDRVQIGLSGTPINSIPQLQSPDAAEQIRLNNHTSLIPSLSKRWTRAAANHFDNLVHEVNRKILENPAHTVRNLTKTKLDDHRAMRGREALSMVHAAVCQAVIDKRPGYMEEFASPNAPRLE